MISAEDGPDADRGRAQVEGQHHDPDDHEDALGPGVLIGSAGPCTAQSSHPPAADRARPTPLRLAGCANNPSNRPRRSSGCGSATPSGAGCGSPATATSPAPSSGHSCGPGSRWPTPRASTRTRGSRTPERRRPAPPARRSTSRSAWRPRSTPLRWATALDEALPAGLDVVEVVESAGGSLADRLEASHWRITVDLDPPAGPRPPWPTFLAAGEVLVERMTKKGLRTLRLPRRRRVARVTRLPGPSG